MVDREQLSAFNTLEIKKKENLDFFEL